MEETASASVLMPVRVWIEKHREQDACDVIVEMEDGSMYTALFATIAYLERQMDLCYEVTKQLAETPCVRYATIDTPHILVEDLSRDTIEDTIDNLLAHDIFEGLFIRLTEQEAEATRTKSDGKLATQEVAAVVLSDVLVVAED